MNNDCIFCKILKAEIPSDKVYGDERVYAFRDINPQAATHILVIPREHIASANELNAGNIALASAVFEAIPRIAAQENITDYRVITNVGRGAGQTVFHMHFHVLAGDKVGERLL